MSKSRIPAENFDDFFIKWQTKSGGKCRRPCWYSYVKTPGCAKPKERSTGLKIGQATFADLQRWRETQESGEVGRPVRVIDPRELARVHERLKTLTSPKTRKLLSKGTLDFYQKQFKAWHNWFEEKYDRLPTYDDLTQKKVSEACNLMEKQGLSQRTIGAYCSALNHIAEYGHIRGHCEHGAGRTLKPRWVNGQSTPCEEYLDSRQMSLLFASWPDPTDPILHYAAACGLLGCNHTEALRLSGASFSYKDDGRLEVHIDGTKTDDRARMFEVPLWLNDEVEKYLLKKEALEITPNAARQRIHRVIKGLNKTYGDHEGYLEMSLVTSNSLRASFCTALFEQGVEETAAYLMMGHANPAMVQRVYNRRGRNSQARAERIKRLNRRTEEAQVRAGNVIPIRPAKGSDYLPTMQRAQRAGPNEKSPETCEISGG